MMGCAAVSLVAAALLPDRSRRDLAVEYDQPAPAPARAALAAPAVVRPAT